MLIFLKRGEWAEGKETQSDSLRAAGNLRSPRHTAWPLITREALRQQPSPIYLAFWGCLVSSLLPPDVVSIHLIFSKHGLTVCAHGLQVAQTGNWYLIHSLDSQCKITGSLHRHHLGSLKGNIYRAQT